MDTADSYSTFRSTSTDIYVDEHIETVMLCFMTLLSNTTSLLNRMGWTWWRCRVGDNLMVTEVRVNHGRTWIQRKPVFTSRRGRMKAENLLSAEESQ